MKYNFELLKADITDELGKLEYLCIEFIKIEKMIENKSMTFYDRGAVGYFLNSFYNGCENIFSLIARFFENDLSPQSWHKDLLRRMKLSVTGFRPSVINEELFRLLNDFRGFRHVFRHSYAYELDWEKEQEVAKKFIKTYNLFNEQIILFIKNIDNNNE